MGPRVCEDDETREGKKKPIKDQRQRTKNLNTAATRPQSSFPCTQETIHPRALYAALGNTLTATNNKNNVNTVVIPTHYTRRTMGPRIREDDEKKTKRKSRQTEVRKKKVRRVKDERKHQQRHYPVKTQHTASTPPGVIPVHTGNHLSARAGCRVWKYTRHNRQQEQRQYSSNTYLLHSLYDGSPRSRG